MALHDQLLDRLLSIADVSLVALLRDDTVGLPADDLRVFLGDVHLISDRRQAEGGYHYFVNHEGLFTELAVELADLRQAALAEGKALAVYQIGDFLDPWREVSGFDASEDAGARIEDDHQDLIAALRSRDLRTTFVFGNHDLELYRWPKYRGLVRRCFLPGGDGGPRVFVTHGDVFDGIERVPDFLKNVMVYYFSPQADDPTFEIGALRDMTIEGHGNRTYLASIGTPSEAGKLLPLGAEALPAEYNVQREGTAPAAGLQYLVEARNACSEANAKYGLRLGAAVIGHTHHPRIAVSAAGQPPFALVDCGAWIERNLCDGKPILNAQVAALCGNEARIYQLAPRATARAAVPEREAIAAAPLRRARAAPERKVQAAAPAPSRKGRPAPGKKTPAPARKAVAGGKRRGGKGAGRRR